MCTPADVENVMAVGGIDPGTGIHIPFSSYGPTSDKRMKPNVSAYAHVIAGDNNKVTEAYGTSFATPLVAGFAACVLQLHPEYTFNELFEEIEKSGNLYPYFDYAHGYGVPQAGYFMEKSAIKNKLITLNAELETTTIHILDQKGILYYHIESTCGQLEKFTVVEMNAENPLTLNTSDLEGKVLRLHYKGETIEQKF